MCVRKDAFRADLVCAIAELGDRAVPCTSVATTLIPNNKHAIPLIMSARFVFFSDVIHETAMLIVHDLLQFLTTCV